MSGKKNEQLVLDKKYCEEAQKCGDGMSCLWERI